MPSLPGDTTDKRQSIANESFMGYCTWIVVREKERKKTKRENCQENDPCPEVRILIIYSTTYYNIFLRVFFRGKGGGGAFLGSLECSWHETHAFYVFLFRSYFADWLLLLLDEGESMVMAVSAVPFAKSRYLLLLQWKLRQWRVGTVLLIMFIK